MTTGNHINMRLGALLVACLFLAGLARAEAIRELVTVDNVFPIGIEGVGIVTGLAGTGEKDKAAHALLLKYLGNAQFDLEPNSIGVGSLALVSVSAEIPPNSHPGSRLPVRVTSLSNAKSLAGGVLLRTNLFVHGKSGEVAAIASGRLTVGPGHLTSGEIAAGSNGGALQLMENMAGTLLEDDYTIRLNLRDPNYADASNIARQINQTPALNPYLQEATMFAEATPTRPVAIAVDKGQVLVMFPEPFRGRVNPNDFMAALLEVPVSVNRPAKITINRAKNVIVVHGDVRVNSSATISLQDKTVTLRPATAELPAAYVLENDTPRVVVETDGPGTNADLQGLIDTLNAMGLSTDQVITVFEQLASAGAIRADMKIE